MKGKKRSSSRSRRCRSAMSSRCAFGCETRPARSNTFTRAKTFARSNTFEPIWKNWLQHGEIWSAGAARGRVPASEVGTPRYVSSLYRCSPTVEQPAGPRQSPIHRTRAAARDVRVAQQAHQRVGTYDSMMSSRKDQYRQRVTTLSMTAARPAVPPRRNPVESTSVGTGSDVASKNTCSRPAGE
jgi:hypothetical protein